MDLLTLGQSQHIAGIGQQEIWTMMQEDKDTLNRLLNSAGGLQSILGELAKQCEMASYKPVGYKLSYAWQRSASILTTAMYRESIKKVSE